MPWTELKPAEPTRPYDNIPGPARIDQFSMGRSTFGIDIACKNCGESLRWDTDTDRSELLEILAAIEIHQCNSERRLRHVMFELADSLRRGPDGNYSLSAKHREVADLIVTAINDLDPPGPEDDD